VEKIEKEFEGKVRVVVKLYPYKYRDYSRISAEAALAAYDQGKFWEMHSMLLKKSPRLDRASLISYAGALKLDVQKFTRALDSKRNEKTIERDTKLAQSLDLYNTPALFVNGRKIVGNVPYDYLRRIVVEELQR
jgi:protein-disulfide isomerase